MLSLQRILSLWSTGQEKAETEGQAQAGHARDEIVAPAVHDRRHDDRLAVGKACSLDREWIARVIRTAHRRKHAVSLWL